VASAVVARWEGELRPVAEVEAANMGSLHAP
jgi:hypothetical protein